MEKKRYYIAKHKDIRIRMNSRSGGVFTALSDEWLKRGGVIYGCVLDDELNVRHIRAEDSTGRDRMRGSKYVQSDIGNCYSMVCDDLKAGRYVLFSGTSCQIAGLRTLTGENEKLLCVDIVCHGVPSPLVWNDYLNYWKRKKKTPVTSADFRNKKDHGWVNHIETIRFGNEETDSRIFTELFFQHRVLRPSCYCCPYKSLDHPGDITIADAWGVQIANPEFDDNKGVSLLLINTALGESLLTNIKDDCDLKAVEIIRYMQEPLLKPFEKPIDRDDFWKQYNTKSFDYIAKKYTEAALHRRIRAWLGRQKRYIENILRGKKGEKIC